MMDISCFLFEEGILTDEDRQILTSYEVELDRDTKAKVFEEQFWFIQL